MPKILTSPTKNAREVVNPYCRYVAGAEGLRGQTGDPGTNGDPGPRGPKGNPGPLGSKGDAGNNAISLLYKEGKKTMLEKFPRNLGHRTIPY